jgi:hypothetical protein
MRYSPIISRMAFTFFLCGILMCCKKDLEAPIPQDSEAARQKLIRERENPSVKLQDPKEFDPSCAEEAAHRVDRAQALQKKFNSEMKKSNLNQFAFMTSGKCAEALTIRHPFIGHGESLPKLFLIQMQSEGFTTLRVVSTPGGSPFTVYNVDNSKLVEEIERSIMRRKKEGQPH